MVTATKDSEKDQVENHRRTYFRQILGKDIPADDIEQLVHSTADTHKAERMMREGCSPELIVLILL